MQHIHAVANLHAAVFVAGAFPTCRISGVNRSCPAAAGVPEAPSAASAIRKMPVAAAPAAVLRPPAVGNPSTAAGVRISRLAANASGTSTTQPNDGISCRPTHGRAVIGCQIVRAPSHQHVQGGCIEDLRVMAALQVGALHLSPATQLSRCCLSGRLSNNNAHLIRGLAGQGHISKQPLV